MIKQTKGIFRIGTSGIALPGGKNSFPVEFQNKSRLTYYSSLFNTIEVNSTFKKIPKHSTFEKWSLEVSEEFQFTIKLWKEVTHRKQLNIDLDKIDAFINSANYIGNKKGCLLIQFPGSITAEYAAKVDQVLERLQKADYNNQWRLAVEFRSNSWYSNETESLLQNYHASMVLHDMPKSKQMEPNEGAKFVYFRFHGPKGDYRGSYSSDFLEEQAQKIQTLLASDKDVYAYFNNTMGDEFENAMSLKAMVEK